MSDRHDDLDRSRPSGWSMVATAILWIFATIGAITVFLFVACLAMLSRM